MEFPLQVLCSQNFAYSSNFRRNRPLKNAARHCKLSTSRFSQTDAESKSQPATWPMFTGDDTSLAVRLQGISHRIPLAQLENAPPLPSPRDHATEPLAPLASPPSLPLRPCTACSPNRRQAPPPSQGSAPASLPLSLLHSAATTPPPLFICTKGEPSQSPLPRAPLRIIRPPPSTPSRLPRPKLPLGDTKPPRSSLVKSEPPPSRTPSSPTLHRASRRLPPPRRRPAAERLLPDVHADGPLLRKPPQLPLLFSTFFRLVD